MLHPHPTLNRYIGAGDGASEGLVDGTDGTVDASGLLLPPEVVGLVPLPLDVQADRSLGVEDPGENLKLRRLAEVGDDDVLYVSNASLR
jgi:hypothetical protein